GWALLIPRTLVRAAVPRLASKLNSTVRSSYSAVICGSPSHRMAIFSPRPCSIWRSRQLYDRLVFPPTNHLASGQFHSSTLSHFLNQCSASACLPQNVCGSSIDWRYIRSYSSRDLTATASSPHPMVSRRCRCSSRNASRGLFSHMPHVLRVRPDES